MPPEHDLLAQMQRTPIIDNSLAIWGLGQMGVAIKGPEGLIYIDPYLSNSGRRDVWRFLGTGLSTPPIAATIG